MTWKPKERWHGCEVYGQLDVNAKTRILGGLKVTRSTHCTIPGHNSLPSGHYKLVRVSERPKDG